MPEGYTATHSYDAKRRKVRILTPAGEILSVAHYDRNPITVWLWRIEHHRIPRIIKRSFGLTTPRQ
jgi:hypothetical protein